MGQTETSHLKWRTLEPHICTLLDILFSGKVPCFGLTLTTAAASQCASNRIKPIVQVWARCIASNRIKLHPVHTILLVLFLRSMYEYLGGRLMALIGSAHPVSGYFSGPPSAPAMPGELPLRSIRILSSCTERRVWNMIEPSITCSTYLVHIYCTH